MHRARGGQVPPSTGQGRSLCLLFARRPSDLKPFSHAQKCSVLANTPVSDRATNVRSGGGSPLPARPARSTRVHRVLEIWYLVSLSLSTVQLPARLGDGVAVPVRRGTTIHIHSSQHVWRG